MPRPSRSRTRPWTACACFSQDDDAAAVSAAYTDADGIWTINDTAQLPELEGIFIRPLVIYAACRSRGRTPCSPCASRCRQPHSGDPRARRGSAQRHGHAHRQRPAQRGRAVSQDGVRRRGPECRPHPQQLPAAHRRENAPAHARQDRGGRALQFCRRADVCRHRARPARAGVPQGTVVLVRRDGQTQRPRSSRAPRTMSRRSRRCAC